MAIALLLTLDVWIFEDSSVQRKSGYDTNIPCPPSWIVGVANLSIGVVVSDNAMKAIARDISIEIHESCLHSDSVKVPVDHSLQEQPDEALCTAYCQLKIYQCIAKK